MPYSGKLSRDKTFVVLWLFTKVFSLESFGTIIRVKILS